ncbi:hypothetical protein NE237_011696 [Protea cynaroides]|uniref:Uncharacterized protein n=1 Tax=Protea cynaroides TaxID=273540 RepID=A0A9Q0GW44_9MAGN|nr:hypothetical protein NE237_011696 [Protea cynaroides]
MSGNEEDEDQAILKCVDNNKDIDDTVSKPIEFATKVLMVGPQALLSHPPTDVEYPISGKSGAEMPRVSFFPVVIESMVEEVQQRSVGRVRSGRERILLGGGTDDSIAGGVAKTVDRGDSAEIVLAFNDIVAAIGSVATTTGELMDLRLCGLDGIEIFREAKAIAEGSVADYKELKESSVTAVSILHGGVVDVLQMGSNVEGVDQVFSAAGSMVMVAACDNSDRVANVGDEALHRSDRTDMVTAVVLSAGHPETTDGVLQSEIDYASVRRRSLQEVTHGRASVWGVANSGDLLPDL